MILILLIIIILLSNSAYAYIGPGLGGGTIVAVIGIVVAIFAAFFGILWFPIKRFVQKRRKAKQEKNQN